VGAFVIALRGGWNRRRWVSHDVGALLRRQGVCLVCRDNVHADVGRKIVEIDRACVVTMYGHRYIPFWLPPPCQAVNGVVGVIARVSRLKQL
jgi:hypothetical protein